VISESKTSGKFTLILSSLSALNTVTILFDTPYVCSTTVSLASLPEPYGLCFFRKRQDVSFQ